MKFYKDRFNKWHNEDDFLKMAQIFSSAFPKESFYLPSFLKDVGCIKEEKVISSPNVIDYLKMDMKVDAVKQYYNIHRCTLKEAREKVEQIKEDMENTKDA